ncbi:MAG: hypothetical protein J6U01_05945 [Clostridia bacterium]|nr:hypothetical protein [Clostridia bacterium]
MDMIKELGEMKETIANEIAEANQRIRQSGGDLNAGDVEIIDKLAHSMKSLVSTCAMLEAEEEDDGGYSGRFYYRDGRGGYSRRERRNGYSGNYGGYSRENRGRYSRDDGYSREGMMDHFRQMMDEAPDEQTRIEIKRMMDQMQR